MSGCRVTTTISGMHLEHLHPSLLFALNKGIPMKFHRLAYVCATVALVAAATSCSSSDVVEKPATPRVKNAALAAPPVLINGQFNAGKGGWTYADSGQPVGRGCTSTSASISKLPSMGHVSASALVFGRANNEVVQVVTVPQPGKVTFSLTVNKIFPPVQVLDVRLTSASGMAGETVRKTGLISKSVVTTSPNESVSINLFGFNNGRAGCSGLSVSNATLTYEQAAASTTTLATTTTSTTTTTTTTTTTPPKPPVLVNGAFNADQGGWTISGIGGFVGKGCATTAANRYGSEEYRLPSMGHFTPSALVFGGRQREVEQVIIVPEPGVTTFSVNVDKVLAPNQDLMIYVTGLAKDVRALTNQPGPLSVSFETTGWNQQVSIELIARNLGGSSVGCSGLSVSNATLTYVSSNITTTTTIAPAITTTTVRATTTTFRSPIQVTEGTSSK